MKLNISTGGQISIPAEVRRRWGTKAVLIEDRGESLIVRPMPDDPIAHARGSLKGRGINSEEARRQVREEEAEIYDRKHREWGSTSE